jgi:predicted Zn-ribbon and HTH transcriptional regulator
MVNRACYEARPPGTGESRTALGVDGIFRAYGEAYRQGNVLTPPQHAVMRAIEACRTAALGGHLDVCLDCGHELPSYNSCRNRHCPKCQSLEQAKWIESRLDRILPVPYFHLVFTLPHELNAIVLRNAAFVYDLLFDSASGALLKIAGDPEHLGVQPGVTMVLHTWTRDLQLHPHVHAIVTGGGLIPGTDRWVAAKPRFFLPILVLGDMLRGKVLAALRKAYDRHELDLGGACAPLARPRAFKRLLDGLYTKKWVVYAKRAFGGAEQVVRYLGRYTHRTGISNQRILSMDDQAVRFRTRGDKVAVLAPSEFIRRFLLHVLPPGFKKIRHSGLLAPSNVNTRLVVARRALDAADPPPRPHLDWRDRLFRLTGIDPTRCPACGATLLRRPLPVEWTAPVVLSRPAPALENSS